MSCPCGTAQSYEACCGPFIEDGRLPETPEQLMRSRYTAFTRTNIDYVVGSHDPKTRSTLDKDGTVSWLRGAEWKGLEIHSTKGGGADEKEGWVEFTARYEMDGEPQEQYENALFRRMKNRWFYIDSTYNRPPVVRDAPKIGRNDACPCGSKRKYKHCCGRG